MTSLACGPTHFRLLRLSALLALIFLLVQPVRATIDFRNCDQHWQLPHAPERIVALNQHAADLLIALGEGSRLFGVSWLDDSGVEKDGRYRGVPVISKHYPSLELLLGEKIDFAVAGFGSGFIPGQGPGSRKMLQNENIGTYLLEDACFTPRKNDAFNNVRYDIVTMANILGVPEKASATIASFDDALAKAKSLALPQPLQVLVYDSELRAPYIAAGANFVNALLELVGVRNSFSDLGSSYVHVAWEEIMVRDPDVIILVDASFSPAQMKREFLENDPVLSRMRAVRQRQYVTLRFSLLTPSIQSAEAAAVLAEQLYQLVHSGMAEAAKGREDE